MITIIFGAPGSGKSSLNTYFLKQVYRREGRSRLERAKELIGRVNEERATPLTVPDQPPIFANYRVKFKTGYEKWFEPYFVNGYYLGLANENMPTQYIPPASAVFLGEAQRFFNSRKSQTLPDWVSRFYEMHRHYHVDFYMDVQRPGLIDANLREICKNFIEVRGMEHEKDSAGRIVHTKFRCWKFGDWTAVEQYLKTGEGHSRKCLLTMTAIFSARSTVIVISASFCRKKDRISNCCRFWDRKRAKARRTRCFTGIRNPPRTAA